MYDSFLAIKLSELFTFESEDEEWAEDVNEDDLDIYVKKDIYVMTGPDCF